MKSNQKITYQLISVNGINLHTAMAGPRDGEPVILLHGFPDASFGWKEQMIALAEQNYFVIAPDQRGYNLSDKPRGKKNYMMKVLVADIIALADELGFKKFNLAGHDFGALVSWNLVENFGKRVKRLVIFNVPHPKVLKKFQRENKEQRRKSWYAYFFKLPLLPELLVKRGNWKFLASAMKNSFSNEEIDKYRTAWSRPGAIAAMINWYRCLFLQKADDRPKNRITVPTLIVWGKQDPHLMWEMASESAAMCENGRVKYLEDATHWVLKDEPEKTSRFLIDFFKPNKH